MNAGSDWGWGWVIGAYAVTLVIMFGYARYVTARAGDARDALRKEMQRAGREAR